MEHSQFERLKSQITTKASASQIIELKEAIRLVISQQVADIALARRSHTSTESRICPHCKATNVVLHGRDKNQRQRFKCRECKRTYNTLTGTPMARARKPEKWGKYLSFMTDHVSIRRIVEAGIGLNHVTVWRWRHRFLKAAAENKIEMLSGVVEADETFFLKSFKGHRGWQKANPPENRAARPRAWGAITAGLSHQQVPVLTALDNAGGVYEDVLSTRADIEKSLTGHVAPGSVLCSDGARAYVKVAVASGSEHRRVILPKTTYLTKMGVGGQKSRPKGRLGLGHVNAHHGRLKSFINIRCRGVATKYLANYLGWIRAMQREGFAGNALLDMAVV